MSKKFIIELNKLIIENLFNDFTDNHDFYRFGPVERVKSDSYFRTLIRQKLNKSGYYSTSNAINYVQKKLDHFSDRIDYFHSLYDLLEDDYSRALLIKVCAFRILGETKIKLPMNNESFWKGIKTIEVKCSDKNDFILANFVSNWKLYKHNLNSIGYPINLYLRSANVYYDFIYNCYSYSDSEPPIKVEKGDYVIDAGGCYGDTALYFAHMVGSRGKVFTFEFVPQNLDILNRNLDLNPSLREHITLFEFPLWKEINIPVYFELNGPGTKVSMSKISENSKVVLTTTIDELVRTNKIEKIDFIKMDIEGAELNALIGAKESISRFKPKLAISVYHNARDFKVIPEFIKGLNLGYKFYFGHCTIHEEESVLFCIS